MWLSLTPGPFYHQLKPPLHFVWQHTYRLLEQAGLPARAVSPQYALSQIPLGF